MSSRPIPPNLGLQGRGSQHENRSWHNENLWVIKIKKPTILCACSTSRSREQSTKRRSRSVNMRKVCLFYSRNNKIVRLSNMADTFWEIHAVRKGLWAFFLIVLFGCWLAAQTLITWYIHTDHLYSTLHNLLQQVSISWWVIRFNSTFWYSTRSRVWILFCLLYSLIIWKCISN